MVDHIFNWLLWPSLFQVFFDYLLDMCLGLRELFLFDVGEFQYLWYPILIETLLAFEEEL